MSFCFKRKESVARAIRRLGCGRSEAAHKCLKDCRRAEAIHCVRKEIKKARAILRLARGGLREEDCRRVLNRLREAASHLAPVRDAHVKSAALKDLVRHFKNRRVAPAWRRMQIELNTRARREVNRFVKRRTDRDVARRLQRAANRFDELKVEGQGWQLLGAGVKQAYRKGRKAYATARTQPQPEHFHQWRKRVKDVWYDLRMLQPLWPEQMDALAKRFGTLGEHLGNDHDLFLLQQFVGKQANGAGAWRQTQRLERLIEQRQQELRKSALELGAQCYAEKPSVFSKRLRQYWRRWRRGKSPATV